MIVWEVSYGRFKPGPARLSKIRRYLEIAILTTTAFCLSACSTRNKPAAEKTVDELLSELANDTNDRVRITAVRELSRSNNPVAVVALIVALKDQVEEVRMSAASALGGSKDPRAAEALWTAVRDPTQSQGFRLTAACALARLHDPRAIEPLIESLPHARSDASAALVELGKAAVPRLIEAVRAASPSASRALVDIGEPAVGPLIEVLRNDEAKSARLTAASTLADMDDTRGNAALTDALQAGELIFVAASYRFLIRQGTPGTEKQLIGALERYGKLDMAQDFISSGNAELKAAAEAWARKKNYLISARTSDLPEVHWAGVDPGVKRLELFHFDGSLTSVAGSAPVEARGISFISSERGRALSIDRGGILKYPLRNNLDFRDGTIEMWIAPRLNGSDAVYAKYNHALLLYVSPRGEQFIISENASRRFYAGTYVKGEFAGVGGGDISNWQAGEWHHVAFSYSSRPSRQRMFIDGVQVSHSQAEMARPVVGTPSFTAGCDPWGNWPGFYMDELQISQGEKSADTIRHAARQRKPSADH